MSFKRLGCLAYLAIFAVRNFFLANSKHFQRREKHVLVSAVALCHLDLQTFGEGCRGRELKGKCQKCCWYFCGSLEKLTVAPQRLESVLSQHSEICTNEPDACWHLAELIPSLPKTQREKAAEVHRELPQNHNVWRAGEEYPVWDPVILDVKSYLCFSEYQKSLVSCVWGVNSGKTGEMEGL